MKTQEKLDSGLREHVHTLAHSSGIYDQALEYFLSHPCIKGKPTLQVQEFARQKADQVAWLSSLATTKRQCIKSLGFTNTNEFYARGIVLINEDAKALEWHSFKLSSLLGLVKRLTNFKKAFKDGHLNVAFESLIDKRYGNQNASRLGAEQQAYILSVYSDRINKPGYKITFKLYSARASEMIKLGFWKEQESEICMSTLVAFLRKPSIKNKWYALRNL